MQRPTGITILAIADFLSGAFSLAIACLTMVVSGGLRTRDEDADDPSVLTLNLSFRGNPVFWVGVVGAGISLFKVLAAIGLWTRQPWGRRIALVSGTLTLLTNAFGVLRGAITPSGLMDLIVDGAVLVYLSRPDARHALVAAPIDVPATAP